MNQIEDIPALNTFVTTHHIEAVRQNERPWGGYELVLVIADASGQRTGFTSNRAWGASIPTHIAIQDLLRYYAHETPDSAPFSRWLGEARLRELQQILTPSGSSTTP